MHQQYATRIQRKRSTHTRAVVREWQPEDVRRRRETSIWEGDEGGREREPRGQHLCWLRHERGREMKKGVVKGAKDRWSKALVENVGGVGPAPVQHGEMSFFR